MVISEETGAFNITKLGTSTLWRHLNIVRTNELSIHA